MRGVALLFFMFVALPMGAEAGLFLCRGLEPSPNLAFELSLTERTGLPRRADLVVEFPGQSPVSYDDLVHRPDLSDDESTVYEREDVAVAIYGDPLAVSTVVFGGVGQRLGLIMSCSHGVPASL